MPKNRSWPDEERWELIEGTAYEMAGPNRAHQAVVTVFLRAGTLFGPGTYIADDTPLKSLVLEDFSPPVSDFFSRV